MGTSNQVCGAGRPARRWRLAGAALVACLPAMPAAALQLGQSDTFAGGALGGWGTGAASPAPPSVVATGGPGGAGDAYLRLTSTGQAGAGGKLVAIAGPQWEGNYSAAGITGLSMWLQNQGATDLSLRLWLAAPTGNVVSATPVLLPAASGWQAASFSLLPGALTGQGAATLANVQELRLFHGTGPDFPGANIAAQLGVDSISAVPEPAAASLLLAGLVGLVGLLARHRGRRQRPLHLHQPAQE